jgi:hypothetical protein
MWGNTHSKLSYNKIFHMLLSHKIGYPKRQNAGVPRGLRLLNPLLGRCPAFEPWNWVPKASKCRNSRGASSPGSPTRALPCTAGGPCLFYAPPPQVKSWIRPSNRTFHYVCTADEQRFVTLWIRSSKDKNGLFRNITNHQVAITISNSYYLLSWNIKWNWDNLTLEYYIFT